MPPVREIAHVTVDGRTPDPVPDHPRQDYPAAARAYWSYLRGQGQRIGATETHGGAAGYLVESRVQEVIGALWPELSESTAKAAMTAVTRVVRMGGQVVTLIPGRLGRPSTLWVAADWDHPAAVPTPADGATEPAGVADPAVPAAKLASVAFLPPALPAEATPPAPAQKRAPARPAEATPTPAARKRTPPRPAEATPTPAARKRTPPRPAEATPTPAVEATPTVQVVPTAVEGTLAEVYRSQVERLQAEVRALRAERNAAVAALAHVRAVVSEVIGDPD